MKKKLVNGLLCLGLAIALVTGCGRQDDNNGSTGGNTSQGDNVSSGEQSSTGNSAQGSGATGKTGSVYYLSFKPEIDAVWKRLAADYEKETGVPVKVVTAANNTYEQTLMSEIANKEAPTLFQINGPVGYQNWKDYCADLSHTRLYEWLFDKDMAVKGQDGGVYGIPYVVEGYGIIYNDAIMRKYFSLSGAKAASMDEINNFQKLKAVVEDMQSRKDELGIKGVFASTSLNPGDDWRWQTHLANIPISYEYQDKGITDTDKLDFTYGENFKNIFDLYLDNSCTARGLLGSKSTDDSMTEFALGQVAMVQNGNWAWGQIKDVEGNVVAAEDIKFLPIYTGMPGEENQGLCTGTENFFAINSKASPEDQAASIAFVEWLFSSEAGKKAVTEELGFIAPFSTFEENEKPTDPLAKEVLRYMEDDTKKAIPWNFTSFPSEQFKSDFGAALLEYASGSKSWDEVRELVKDRWAAEKNM
jgi:raffinose/stachyose/melibiose transport system substrate-binding protein